MNPAKASKKVVGIIPARYASSRFPGKPLADIQGKPMIWWVYQAARKSKLLTEIFIATEDKRIAETCTTLKLPYVMTGTKHPTGTDRIAEAAKKLTADYFVNIQGDEPLIDPKVIDAAIQPLLANRHIQVTNLMAEITRMSDVVNSNIPKVVVNAAGEAVFLSRLPIPFPKTGTARYFRQVCVYGFTPESLAAFASLPQGTIEKSEEIELLRFIENRIPVTMIEVKSENIAVDTPGDLEQVRKILREKKAK